jgi:SAM-dependent methyltransferase
MHPPGSPPSGGHDESNAARARRAAEFDAAYAGTPPWDIGRPQAAFARLATTGALHGRVLDIGCGTGEHTLLAASLGLEAVGVDVSPAAIERATAKARDRHMTARFVVDDALALPDLGERFDTVLDCGLFHGFDDDERVRFVDSLHAVIAPGGRYCMLCFSELQPGDWGPRRVRQEEIRACFAAGWSVESIESATIEITMNPDGAHAWLSLIARV